MLSRSLDRIWDAARELGLDPFPTHFEVVPAHIMYQLGAYGIPGRFSHWTHGRAYHLLKTRYDHGLQRIYELVINTNPCQAFLLDSNTELENTLIAAHVLGHSDFFKNNIHFRNTNRRMTDTAMVHAERLRQYEFEHGTKEVEHFLDAVLSLREHSGPHAGSDVYRPRDDRRVTPYDDLLLLGQRRKSVFARLPSTQGSPERCPERDLLYFLQHYAPNLDEWQRDIIDIVRIEWLYFRPQLRTKLANEGWATLWHKRVMRALDLDEREFFQYAKLHAQVAAPSEMRLDPCFLGMKLWEHIDDRWGRDTLYEARELESDVSLVRNYLDADLVDELDLFTYELRGTRWTVRETAGEWEAVRDQLVDELSDRGVPDVRVVDDDYQGSRELYLFHDYNGVELDQRYAQKTLEHIYSLWGRPVHLETVFGDMLTELTCRGPGDIQVENKGRYVS